MGANNGAKEYITPNDEIKKMVNTCWFTNIKHNVVKPFLKLKTMEENIKDSIKEYIKYDNYDAIEVSRVKDIPCDYDGVMGVPITFLYKYNPEQFEVVGATESEGRGFSNGLWDSKSKVPQPMVNGVRVYKRLFVKNK